MKYLFSLATILLTMNILSAQDSIKTYKIESRTFEIEKKYQVNEISIKSNSTYINTLYKVYEKSQIANYKNLTPSIKENGTFRKKGDFYFLKPYNQNFEMGCYKITAKKMVYYYDWHDKIKKGAIFRRIKQ
ncbi:hypothetical protein [Flavobacterium restrictum]|uniref:GLPGLI family protein n=1 Tax=Flavobacterium restrictum TaxID=2594428 RepID=A0A553DXF6_9FLAO|nr:hypothetical protein [Flavobacterium restrictum]TRX37488.1 hypothetical protein FNW21_11935 [Flavobacterium restrictum]